VNIVGAAKAVQTYVASCWQTTIATKTGKIKSPVIKFYFVASQKQKHLPNKIRILLSAKARSTDAPGWPKHFFVKTDAVLKKIFLTLHAKTSLYPHFLILDPF